MDSVALGIVKRKNSENKYEFLLVSVENEKWGKNSLAYYPPGGHVLGNETEEETIIRKIKEEINIHVLPIKKISSTSGDLLGQMCHWWECDFLGGKIKINKSSIKDAGFFTLKQMEDMKLWPATRNFFEKHMEGVKK